MNDADAPDLIGDTPTSPGQVAADAALTVLSAQGLYGLCIAVSPTGDGAGALEFAANLTAQEALFVLTTITERFAAALAAQGQP